MAIYKGTTHAMTNFLRACAKNPDGPPPSDWPSITILRRWLRRKAFRRALCAVRETHHFCSDFHLSAASTRAAVNLEQLNLHSDLPDPDEKTNLDLLHSRLHVRKSKVAEAVHTLRLSHLRQRFPSTGPAPTTSSSPASFPENLEDLPKLLQIQFLQQAFDLLARGHESLTLAQAKDFWSTQLEKLRADYQQSRSVPASPRFARDLK